MNEICKIEIAVDDPSIEMIRNIVECITCGDRPGTAQKIAEFCITQSASKDRDSIKLAMTPIDGPFLGNEYLEVFISSLYFSEAVLNHINVPSAKLMDPWMINTIRWHYSGFIECTMSPDLAYNIAKAIDPDFCNPLQELMETVTWPSVNINPEVD